METTVAPALTAASMAFSRSELLLEAATDRIMVAPGAMAWAHSTSSAVSIAQPVSVPALFPRTWTVVELRPNWVQKVFRSFWIWELPYASTMAIFWLAPVADN